MEDWIMLALINTEYPSAPNLGTEGIESLNGAPTVGLLRQQVTACFHERDMTGWPWWQWCHPTSTMADISEIIFMVIEAWQQESFYNGDRTHYTPQ